ncbi:MAG: hypothetical protein FJ000_06950, partial [Actinobacteria bacterium]|nr:hypothetical protein [Actinomycetota bacterium]
LQTRQTTLHDGGAIQGKKEAELEKAEDKRKALMAKAYGGTIANPKELETLEKEIASLGRTKDRIETELLELFDIVDGASRAVQEHEGLVAGLKSELARTVETYESERARLNGEIEGLAGERAELAGAVGAASLQTYDRLRERLGNLAVAVTDGHICTACRMNIPIVRIKHLIEGSDFEKCESCLRLLWIERDPDDTDAEDSAGAAE